MKCKWGYRMKKILFLSLIILFSLNGCTNQSKSDELTQTSEIENKLEDIQAELIDVQNKLNSANEEITQKAQLIAELTSQIEQLKNEQKMNKEEKQAYDDIKIEYRLYNDFFESEINKALVEYNIEESTLLQLIDKAMERYKDVLKDYNENENDYFDIDNEQYSFFSPEIDTEEEIANYLSEYYTDEVARQIANSYSSKDNRLYHSRLNEYSTLKSWHQVELLDINKITENAYEIIVKVPDSDYFDIETLEIVSSENDWKLNSMLDY